ncbi:putative methyltransferase chromatin regulator PHD family [Lupinus albus]|uniref:RING-type E3 ubiquitin transferase n=1 Tax=Lupinus albus TaxID=3870 RepID=A0A6A4Q0G8_LUPAL|nr:putative methyltransferase chromatin regulator PHD family [Lupinus albus]
MALPCDSDGICMFCKTKPTILESLICNTCITPWHLPCLPITNHPSNIADSHKWVCPDCLINSIQPVTRSNHDGGGGGGGVGGGGGSLMAAVRVIQLDTTLTDEQKDKKRQQLLIGSLKLAHTNFSEEDVVNSVLHVFDGSECSICMQLPERPVTTPCGHNFCLRCFEKWISQGSSKCANCRCLLPPKMAKNPRINSQLAIAIRLAKMARSGCDVPGGPPKVYQFIHNQDRPDSAFTTERAKKPGLANACSGKILVTVPQDHLGPIPAENDPTRNRGVLVGDTWMNRMACRQWGAHFPHISGICGQSTFGAQSVALSGGYVDDEDHGEWFLYTGSGGRDLSGNKRTNKNQSFDQKFENMNEALRLSCLKGYPVRVVRSSKEKRSAYAPDEGVRYDGIYRIEKCWRKVGKQGCKVCRYLFVRCDNEPAPWTSHDCGDRPRPLPKIKELKDAVDLTERKGAPSWDYDEEKGCWLWKRPPPESRKLAGTVSPVNGNRGKVKRKLKTASVKEKLLKGISFLDPAPFACQICRKVLANPLTTPCAHNFCKACLEGVFSGQSFVRERVYQSGRSLRTQKNVMKCPSCQSDIAEFLQNPQVNRPMMSIIEALQREAEQMEENSSESSGKNDENEKNVNDESEVSEQCDSSEEVLEENKAGDMNQAKKKFRKCAKGAVVENKEEHNDEAIDV